VNVLYVEDDVNDSDLACRALAHHAPHIALETVATLGEARARLAGPAPCDLVLTDLSLPDGSGLDLVAAIRGQALPVAVVVLTGELAAESAVAALKAGADDYLLKRKDYLAGLPAVLDRALIRFRAEAARRARPLRVLYAEDSPAEIDLTRRHFARHAPHVRLDAVSSRVDLLARLLPGGGELSGYDAVLLDYYLAGRDALDVLKVLRDERHLEIPIVVITGHGDGEIAAQAFRFGAADFMVKQTGYLFQLTAVLEAACDRARLQREQTALRESEERFRVLFDQAGVGVAHIDAATGRFLRANRRCCDLLGYSEAELLERDYRRLTHPDDLAESAAQVDRVRDREIAEFSIEKRYVRKDGRVIWVHLTVAPLRQHGEPGRDYIAVLVDITARKASEAAADERRRIIGAIADTLPGMLYVYDITKSRGTYRNRGMATLLEVSDDEVRDLLDARFAPIFHPDDLANVPKRVAEIAAARDGDVLEHEYRIRTPSGQWKWLHAWNTILSRTPKGRPAELLGLAIDVTEHRAATEALRASEAMLRETQRIAGLGAWTWDLRTNSAQWSDGLCQIFGIAPSSLLTNAGQVFLDAVHPDDRARVSEISRAAVVAQRPFEVDYRVVRPDGEVIDIHARGEIVSDADGPLRMVGSSQDVTARKAADALLRKSEAMLREAQRLAHVGSWSVNVVDGSSWWSDETYRIFGIEPAAFTGTLMEAFRASIHPGDRARMEASIATALADGRRSIEDFRAIRPDGQVIYLTSVAEALVDADGRRVGLHGATQDITERKHAEQVLYDRDAQLRAVFESSFDGILITRPDGTIHAANPHACRMLGGSEKDIQQLGRQGLADPADPRWTTGLAQRAATGEFRGELNYLRLDGSMFPAEVSSRVLRDQNGVEWTVTWIHDITDRVEAERQRQAIEAQLRQSQRLEAVGTLAGGIAHDFNNILGAIVGHADLALHHVDANAPAVHNLEAVRRASYRARDLVRRILTFSQQSAGHHGVVVLRALVEEAVGLLRATIPASVEMSVTAEDAAPEVIADPTQIHQVVMNLCTNAWQAMEGQPGRIDLRLAGVTIGEDAAVRASELRPGRYARLSVADTGRGMEADLLDRIFEPFFTTKAPGEGTGLGLSVVHGIVRAHGGAVEVRSEPGHGTAFAVYFPAADAPVTADDAVTARAPVRHGWGQHVLFLDDEDDLVQLAEEALVLHGYWVSGYTRATDALEALRADPGRFAVVVSDVSMPGTSGFDVAREVARLRPDLPVVLTSGHVTEELRTHAAGAGVRVVLGKPYELHALADIIDRVTDDRRLPTPD